MLMNTWHNPLPDIIQRFSKYSQEGNSNVLIEFLTILPEEISNKRLKLGQNRRDHLKRVFSSSSSFILQYLETNLKTCVENMQTVSPGETQSKLRLIYKCFSSWIQEHLIDANLINNSQLLIYIFHILCQPETDLDLHEDVTNCLVNMLFFYPFNVRATESNHDLLVTLKQNICNLTGAYRQAEAQGSVEKCIDFALIFTELCNALSFYFISEPNSSLGELTTINLLLLCGTHSEYEVFQKTFLFWFNISEEIYTNANSEKLCKQFRDYVYSLIDCVCKHCRIDQEAHSSSLKNDDFEDFRVKASDLIADVVFIVEANKCFEKMYMILQAPNASWFEIESALFIMCSFSKSISQDEERSVAQVIQSIVNLPEHVNNSVKLTGIRLVGELCEWLNNHPQFIDGALNFVCSGFLKAELSNAAANSMLNICTQCQQHMVNHFETLLNIVLSTDSADLPSEASTELLKGAVVILCNLPPAQITQSLLKLCNIQLDGLNKVLNGEVKQGPKSTAVYWLDRLTAIFRTIRIKNIPPGPHPCLPVVEQVWPTLSNCLVKYQLETKVCESCCRALRFLLRCTEKYSSTILESVVRTVIQVYQANHFSCFLYVGSILVDIFGTEDHFKTGLIEMMQVFTNEAFNHIIQSCRDVENISELRKHPDTIDDFFRLALRFMQRCPFEFIDSQIFSPIMTLAVTSISIDHRDANLSVTKFLSEFVALSHKPQIEVTSAALECVRALRPLCQNDPTRFQGLTESNGSLVNKVLAEIGQKMIENTINSTINMTTRDTKDGIADLICELLSANRKQVEADLLIVIKNLRKSNQQGGEIVTERQLIDVHAQILNSNSSGDIEKALFQLEQLYL